MNRDEVARILGRHADDIRRRGVTSLSLFGSVARDEADAESDVDLMVDIDPASRMSLIGFIRLRDYLGDLLDRRIDLVSRGGLHPDLRDEILESKVDVF